MQGIAGLWSRGFSKGHLKFAAPERLPLYNKIGTKNKNEITIAGACFLPILLYKKTELYEINRA